MRFGLAAACLIASLALLSVDPATARAASANESIALAAETLKPGEYLWHPGEDKSAAAGPVSIIVSIPAQRLYVYRDGRLIGASTVSTGAPGNDTPTGDFTILQKKVFHRSNLYANAPMPHMQRLTWDGIALHAGHLPGYPASHGCIRLPKAFARELFAITEMGGTVSIKDDYVDTLPAMPAIAPTPAELPAAVQLTSAGTERLGGTAFDMVTMPGDAPVPAAGSWVAGPAPEAASPPSAEMR